MRTAASTALLMAVLTVPATAGAAITVPAPGIAHRSETRDGQRWHAVTLELGRPGLAVHVSREEHRGKTLSQIAKAERAAVAINANLFRAGFSLCGVAVARGVPWKAVDASACVHGFAWGREPGSFQLLSTAGFGAGSDAGSSALPAGLTDLVSGYPTLVRGGVACDGKAPDVCAIPPAAPAAFAGPNPRTMIGVDRERRRLVLVVADGRELGAAAGLSLGEASTFLRDTLGVWDAVNLDGGGSSELWIGAEGGVVNAPSDGGERPIASAIVVQYDPTLAPASPSALPVEPPSVDERVGKDRRRGAAAGPMFVAFALAGLGYWIWSKLQR